MNNNIPQEEIHPKEAKLRVDINKNESKKGIKIQFVIPNGENMEDSQKEELTQKLQSKLSAGLSEHGLNVNFDTDVPYSNIIGFFIRIQDFKNLILKVLKPSQEETENYL